MIEKNKPQHEDGWMATTYLQRSTSQPGCACCNVQSVQEIYGN